jgi:hypothetical protein
VRATTVLAEYLVIGLLLLAAIVMAVTGITDTDFDTILTRAAPYSALVALIVFAMAYLFGVIFYRFTQWALTIARELSKRGGRVSRILTLDFPAYGGNAHTAIILQNGSSEFVQEFAVLRSTRRMLQATAFEWPLVALAYLAYANGAHTRHNPLLGLLVIGVALLANVIAAIQQRTVTHEFVKNGLKVLSGSGEAAPD